MRKKVLAGAFLAMTAGLIACGQNNPQTPATEAPTTTAAPETTQAPTTEAVPQTTVVTGAAEGYGGPITAEENPIPGETPVAASAF